ncbi:hypothetical protein APSETT444_005184 [Aspergillus pseudonomiae]
MADPLSVTASVAGIVSLGLTVCQGLFSYYGPYKSRYEDVKHTVEIVETLNGTLLGLNGLLAKASVFQHPSVAQQATCAADLMKRCQEHIHKLEAMLAKFRKTSSNGKLTRFKNQVNRMLYPFQKETMMSVKESLTSLQRNLGSALQNLQLSLKVVGQNQMDVVLSYTESTASDTNQVVTMIQGLGDTHTGMDITSGAGGFSISPKLEFHAIVTEDSPSFTFIRHLILSCFGQSLGMEAPVADSQTLAQYLDMEASVAYSQTLAQMVQDGAASPSDTLANGMTLLHAGCSPTRVDSSGETPLDMLVIASREISSVISEPALIEVGREILDAGGHITRSAFPFEHRLQSRAPRHIIGIDRSIYILQQLHKAANCTGSDFPEEAVPLMTRSTAELRSLVHQGVDMKDWILWYMDWPEGLLILLQAGYTAHENALYGALDFDCEASVRILLETGNIHVGPLQLWAAASNPNPRIGDLVIQALVDRRKHLQFLAETHLSVDELSEWLLRPDALIDFQAFYIAGVLQKKGINISGVWEPHPCHPRDCTNISSEISEIRHEERYLLEDFESLMHEILRAYKGYTTEFPELLTGYWLRRMEEYHSCRVTPSEEVIKSLRECGVVLHEPTPPTEIHSPYESDSSSCTGALMDETMLERY